MFQGKIIVATIILAVEEVFTAQYFVVCKSFLSCVYFSLSPALAK